MTGKIRRPLGSLRLGDAPASYSREWAQHLARALVQRAELERTPMIAGYSVSNYTETRSLNAGTATATDVANFVATLVDDLISAGLIGEA